jgi:hypothetical protein
MLIMKTAKKLSALLLCFVLMLGLALPSFAADEIDPHAPIITLQPVVAKKLVPVAGIVSLSANAKLPEGVSGKIVYEWYTTDFNDPNNPKIAIEDNASAATPNLDVAVGLRKQNNLKLLYSTQSWNESYFCKITNYYDEIVTDELGTYPVAKSASVYTEPVTFKVFVNFGQSFLLPLNSIGNPVAVVDPIQFWEVLVIPANIPVALLGLIWCPAIAIIHYLMYWFQK